MRVIMQDPDYPEAVKILQKQFQESSVYSLTTFEDDTAKETIRRLQSVNSWKVEGALQFRFLEYGPGRP